NSLPDPALSTRLRPTILARSTVLSSRRSSTASADAAALTCASAMARSFLSPRRLGVVFGLCLSDVGACARHVVLHLVERLPRGGLAARQVLGAAELQLGARWSPRLEPTWGSPRPAPNLDCARHFRDHRKLHANPA